MSSAATRHARRAANNTALLVALELAKQRQQRMNDVLNCPQNNEFHTYAGSLYRPVSPDDFPGLPWAQAEVRRRQAENIQDGFGVPNVQQYKDDDYSDYLRDVGAFTEEDYQAIVGYANHVQFELILPLLQLRRPEKKGCCGTQSNNISSNLQAVATRQAEYAAIQERAKKALKEAVDRFNGVYVPRGVTLKIDPGFKFLDFHVDKSKAPMDGGASLAAAWGRPPAPSAPEYSWESFLEPGKTEPFSVEMS